MSRERRNLTPTKKPESTTTRGGRQAIAPMAYDGPEQGGAVTPESPSSDKAEGDRSIHAMVAAIAASCRGVAGKNDQAFCDAVATDAATARTLLAAEGFNVFAHTARGHCQPLKVVFDEAEPRTPE